MKSGIRNIIAASLLVLAIAACCRTGERTHAIGTASGSGTGTGVETVPFTATGEVLFNFTVTSDNRYFQGYAEVLSEVKRIVGGPGAFHISAGDIDPAENTFSALQSAFGEDVTWFPALGNHDLGNADRTWLHAYFDRKLSSHVKTGPPGSEKTTYSWDHMDAHFVILNQYLQDGKEDRTDGKIGDELYNWLVGDLDCNTKPLIFIIGHEPAFPVGRHVGSSLDRYKSLRDRFWDLLEDEKVMAHFAGHTHRPSVFRREGGRVYEISAGQARGDNGKYAWHEAFLNVIVRQDGVEFQVYSKRPRHNNFELIKQWCEPVPGRN